MRNYVITCDIYEKPNYINVFSRSISDESPTIPFNDDIVHTITRVAWMEGNEIRIEEIPVDVTRFFDKDLIKPNEFTEFHSSYATPDPHILHLRDLFGVGEVNLLSSKKEFFGGKRFTNYLNQVTLILSDDLNEIEEIHRTLKLKAKVKNSIEEDYVRNHIYSLTVDCFKDFTSILNKLDSYLLTEK